MIAILLGLFAALCWSVHDLLGRRFAPGAGPFRMAFWVVVLGAVFLLPVIAPRGNLWTGGLTGMWPAVALGACYAVAIGSLLKAFSIAPVSVVGPFTSPYPALVVLWGVVNGLSPSLGDIEAVAAIVFGAIIVARFGHEDGGLNAVPRGQRGLLLLSCALASFGFAASTILGQAASGSLGSLETTLISRLPAALLLLPLAVKERPVAQDLPRMTVLAIAAMAVLDVSAVSAVNFMGQFHNKEYGAMAVSAYGGLAVLLATIFLKEKVSAGQWAGIVMIAAGVSYLGYAGT